MNKFEYKFHRQIINKCIQLIDYDCDYIDVKVFNTENELHNPKLTHDIVIVNIHDHFYVLSDGEVEPKIDSVSPVEEILYHLALENPTKLFIVFHDHFDDIKSKNPQNIKFISLGILLHEKQNYINIDAVSAKNTKSKKVGISLNRQARPHRLAVVSYLYGLQLQDYIHISMTHIEHLNETDLLNIVSWDFDNNDEFKKILTNGFNDILKDKNELVRDEAYPLLNNTLAVLAFDNANNFDKNLRPLYKNSFVEFVNETIFDKTLGLVTEKYQNSVYGMNFPVIISVPGTVQYLRDVGFDMFDDIVNHSYDTINNPIERIITAVQSNKHLILNPEQTIATYLHDDIQERFAKNLSFAKNKMYNNFEAKAINNFKEVINERNRLRI